MERGKKSVEFVKCGTCYGWILKKRVTRDAYEKVVVDDDTGNLEKIDLLPYAIDGAQSRRGGEGRRRIVVGGGAWRCRRK
jgi:hypothetical protein